MLGEHLSRLLGQRFIIENRAGMAGSLGAAVVAKAAQWRQESRGCHLRLDFPEHDAAMCVHDLWRRGRDTPATLPVRT